MDRTNLDLDGTLWETDTPSGTMTVLREIYGTDFEAARDTLCRRFRRFLNRGELSDASFLYATLRLYDQPHAAEIPESAGQSDAPQIDAAPPSEDAPAPNAAESGDEGFHRTRPVTPWQSMSCLG